MDRRKFLRAAGAFSLPAFLGTTGLGAAPAALLEAITNADNDDRVLVLVQLIGGNDGLHTVVPIAQYEALAQMRPNIILPENSLIGLNNNTENAFHGNMAEMANLYNESRLGIIQSVGYPNQNRSHFRSTDIWTSASDAEEEVYTGWLGRLLDQDHPAFPSGYPNTDFPDPLAMIMGNVVTSTCQGGVANYSIAVRDPFNFTYIAPGGNTPIPEGNYGEELEYVRQTIAQSNQYGSVVTAAAEAGNSLATYPETGLANQFRNIAYLLSGGIQTRIFVVTLGGFDNHANQVDTNNTTEGMHATLLANLSASIAAFQDDLDQLGLADRVIGMTFSEFGRQVRSNASNGTDHGNAAPLFIFGNCAQGGILGETPYIDTELTGKEGVDFQYDFRDIYGSILVDWFNVPTATVQNLIYPEFQYLPIIGGCDALPVDWLSVSATGHKDYIQVDWQTAAEENNVGFDVERSLDGKTFYKVGFVRGAGSTSEISSYNFKDRDVVSDRLYYYRLKQIDADGRSDYSAIRTARLEGSAVAGWKVGLPGPNPISARTNIQIYAPVDSMADFEIFDQASRRIKTGRYNLIGGRDNIVPLGDLSGFPAGTYVWRLRAGGQAFSRKLVKR